MCVLGVLGITVRASPLAEALHAGGVVYEEDVEISWTSEDEWPAEVDATDSEFDPTMGEERIPGYNSYPYYMHERALMYLEDEVEIRRYYAQQLADAFTHMDEPDLEDMLV